MTKRVIKAKAAPAPVAPVKAAPFVASVPASAVIKAVVANPKKAGSMAHARFARYKAGMTVGDFLKAGGRRDDIRWDLKRGFISLKA